ncbi:MAG: D-glycero-beta-D-manno-heptose-7-phosphate kinase [Alphaproteobacteria bacterium]
MKNKEDIDIIREIKDNPILVIGDIMLDRFVYGKVERISPESPIPVLSVDTEHAMLGGAGNTLANLIHLGCEGRILSVIGDDDRGQALKALAKKSGADTAGFIVSNDRPTIVKTRFLAGHQQMLRADYERVKPVSQHCIKSLLDRAQTMLNGAKAVILSDYGKGLLVPELIKELIKMAQARNIPLLVDPKGRNYSIYAGADVVTPNKKELREATGSQNVDSDDQIVKAASRLIKTSGVKAVVATRSQDGMSVIRKREGGAHENGTQGDKVVDVEATHIRNTRDVEVFDVSGAGDTVIATLAAALGAGADIVNAAALANIAGSIVVSKVGTAPIHAKELEEYLAQKHPERSILQTENRKYLRRIDTPLQAPLMNWHEAREEVLRWKARGLKVGFTNGCFDILHYGHVTYLNEARQHCDRLIVGLNTDASIRLLKGEGRPVHDEQSRSRVLSALGAVDMVVFFGAEEAGQDNTPRALISQLEPDLFFKGGDYTIEQLPEAQIVMRYGGKVRIIPVCQGHSTTRSIKKMQA